MEERSLAIPRKALSDLIKLFIPPDVPPDSSLCLSVVVDDSELNLREFAAYLSLIDSTYGRLSPIGINAYSMRHKDQLKIDKVEHGSVEFKFIENFANVDSIYILFIIYILVKQLKNLSEILVNLSVAYKDYEEGRLLAERRKILRRQIRGDAELIDLSDARKKQLTILIDALLLGGRRLLPKASRFARKYVRAVKIKILSNSEKEREDKRR